MTLEIPSVKVDNSCEKVYIYSLIYDKLVTIQKTL